MLLLIVVLSAIVIFLLVNTVLTRLVNGNVDMDSRLQRYAVSLEDQRVSQDFLSDNHKASNKRNLQINKTSKMMSIIRHLGTRLKKIPQAKILEVKMQQAGLPLLGSEFLVVLAVIVFLSGFVALLLSGSLIIALTVAISSGLLSLMYVEIKLTRRRQSFNNQLGDALLMMANAMRSGFSFMQAVDMVANEMTEPIANEFAKLIGEMRLGVPTDEALENLSQRIGSKDFDLVIVAVIIQRQVGGNLAQIFDSISTTINERIKMKREINTLSAQGRLSGWVLGLLPFAVGAILSAISPGYLIPLFREPLGQIFVGIGLVSQTLGIIFIKKIVDIDV